MKVQIRHEIGDFNKCLFQIVAVIYNNSTSKCKTSVLKLFYIHNELLYVSASHVTVFRYVEVRYIKSVN